MHLLSRDEPRPMSSYVTVYGSIYWLHFRTFSLVCFYVWAKNRNSSLSTSSISSPAAAAWGRLGCVLFFTIRKHFIRCTRDWSHIITLTFLHHHGWPSDLSTSTRLNLKSWSHTKSYIHPAQRSCVQIDCHCHSPATSSAAAYRFPFYDFCRCYVAKKNIMAETLAINCISFA